MGRVPGDRVSALALGPEQTQLVELLLTGPVRRQAAATVAAEQAQEASQRARAASIRWAAENMISGNPGAIEHIPEELREDARREADRLLAFRGAGELKAGTSSAPTLEEFNAAGRADIAERAAKERERTSQVQAEWDAKHGPRSEPDEPEAA